MGPRFYKKPELVNIIGALLPSVLKQITGFKYLLSSLQGCLAASSSRRIVSAFMGVGRGQGGQDPLFC